MFIQKIKQVHVVDALRLKNIGISIDDEGDDEAMT